MKMNLTKLTMISIVFTSSMMTVSSNNMMFSWMSMEINMISFMPIMTDQKPYSDQPMKYFIIQSIASSLMLMSIILNSMIETPLETSIMMMTSMLMKMGLMPFHLWMPTLMSKLSWINCLLIMTIQKIPATIIISQTINMKMLSPPMIISMIMAPISALNHLSTKKIMAYSSISNSPWMILAMYMSKFQFSMFMMIYTTLTKMITKNFKELNIMFINQMTTSKKKNNMNIMLNILSMSGMPPMIGFFPKWMILQNMVYSSTIMSITMILSSTISTFIYMKMIAPMMLSSMINKKTETSKKKISNEIIINSLGIPMILLSKTIT
nr:NADH dehydrogenase subunit 2 [Eusarima sp.]